MSPNEGASQSNGSCDTGFLVPGAQVDRFTVEKELGRGGMGVVYLARDTRLGRQVALKSLPAALADAPREMSRLQNEARVLASLNHPNIATVYEEIEQPKGTHYLVLEYVPGMTLAEKMAQRPSVAESLEICLQIIDALLAAHQKGIVHQDLKPANVKITDEGNVKVLDFGLARMADDRLRDRRGDCLATGVAGTPAYMSPEQIRGRDVDHRTDIWSFGCILYEMLCGIYSLRSDSTTEVFTSTLIAGPDLEELPANTMPALRRIISRCLEKDRDLRYQSVGEIQHDLEDCLSMLHARAVDIKAMFRSLRRPRIAISLAAVLLAVLLTGIWVLHRAAEAHWARTVAIPEAVRRVDRGDYFGAFVLARQAQKYIHGDPTLEDFWSGVCSNCSIVTEPPGAKVSISAYSAADDEWMYLGKSPLEKALVPYGTTRWKIEKDGFATLEVARTNVSTTVPWMWPNERPASRLDFTLWRSESILPGMVLIPPSQKKPTFSTLDFPTGIKASSYMIDKYEVTNRQFKKFVEAGGYKIPQFWGELDFVKDGRVLPLEEALVQFLDSTGQPGPSTWKNGAYPEGRGDYPVCGVSWFEASAYAQWKGCSLPMTYHWVRAALADDDPSYVLRLSNFDMSLAPVGRYKGTGQFGLHDAAGNVREWCLDASGDSEQFRYILGGACSDPTYAFVVSEARSPWDRDWANGFRCAKYPVPEEGSTKKDFSPIERVFRDFSTFVPVSDETFKGFLDNLYSYDKTDLHMIVESIDESSELWIKEKISFNAAYYNERVMAYLLLPKDTEPPYQTAVFFPGGGALYSRSSENLRYESLFGLIVGTGRALLFPVYQGTYERRIDPVYQREPKDTIAYRNWFIQLSKDLQRSVDYLETRADIDSAKLAYLGFSWGAAVGPIMMATEQRLKTGVFLFGGFDNWKRLPSVDAANFAPRVKVPVLMINGAHDSIFPYTAAQKPLFDLLGSRGEEKRHIVYPGGHFIAWENREKSAKEILDWLDRYLGPVK